MKDNKALKALTLPMLFVTVYIVLCRGNDALDLKDRAFDYPQNVWVWPYVEALCALHTRAKKKNMMGLGCVLCVCVMVSVQAGPVGCLANSACLL